MASQTEQAPLKTYRGNCHCGEFVYEVKLPEIKKAYACNCSNCFKKGLLWNFPASADDLTWVKGEEKGLTKYTFGKGELSHHFCPNCGISMIGKKGGEAGAVNATMALNIRTIQGPPGEAFNLQALEHAPFDGAALEPKYVTPPNTVPAPAGDGTLYRGNCHCGAITWALKFKDLKTCASTTDAPFQDRIVECNCSMCQRGGYIWVYPNAELVAISGRDSASYYTFRSRIARKLFCKTCGVHVNNEANPDLGEDEVDKLDEGARNFRQFAMRMMPMNVRTAEDWELVEGLETVKADGWGSIPGAYENP